MLGTDPFAGAAGDISPQRGESTQRAPAADLRPSGARTALLALFALALVVTLAVAVTAVQHRRSAARHPVTAAVLALARTELSGLATTTTSPAHPYDRNAFGQAWSDVDHNGCDTRNDILARDLTATTVKPATDGCVIASGVLADPYTGRTISFVRGEHSADVQIDHVVALANAWASGASTWTSARRLAYANDPRNLLAVDGMANQDKSASDASQWLPPSTGYRCVYVVKQIDVKSTYGLSVTPAESHAMAKALDGCVVA